MKIASTVILSGLAAILFTACYSVKPYYGKEDRNRERQPETFESQIEHTVFFIGDAGDDTSNSKPVLTMLRAQLDRAGENSTIVFLGDNIYPAGMPDKASSLRKPAEARMNAQLNILKKYKGRCVVIPGNHDWNRGGKFGLEGVIREENYVESYLNKGNTFLPDKGCPGPVEVNLGNNLVLIVIDTQWWLHKWEKPQGAESYCSAKDANDFIAQLEGAIQKNRGKQIIVAAHHPIYTNGNHGGSFSLKEHLFPLTGFNKILWIPLPVIGSIYPLYRKYICASQDLGSRKYQLLKKQLTAVFERNAPVIYAAGHDHNLQYINRNGGHYVISGSGSKVNYAAKGHKASFVYSHKGFMRIDRLQNGELWLSAWAMDGKPMNEGRMVYNKLLKK